MTSLRQVPFFGATVQTAFGHVELLWNEAQRLTEVRLMPVDPISLSSPLPDSILPLSVAIEAYFDGEPVDFGAFLPLCAPVASTDFRRRVYDWVATIPYGRLQCYGDVATAIASPKSMRAVGGALGANPIPLIIPCHRVVAANGLGGFSAGCGVDLKRRMLELEQVSLGKA